METKQGPSSDELQAAAAAMTGAYRATRVLIAREGNRVRLAFGRSAGAPNRDIVYDVAVDIPIALAMEMGLNLGVDAEGERSK